ncbi:MAG: outer membrane protein assembly factor BamE [Caldimonas sp.]
MNAPGFQSFLAALHRFGGRAGVVVALAAVVAGCGAVGAIGPMATEANLAAIKPGMTRDEVLARVGRPTWVFGVRQENLSIWNYRFYRGDCVIYQISIRPDGTVRDSATGYDPACDGPNRS